MKLSKQAAIQLFGGQSQDLARALGVTPGAVSQWPEDLRPEQVDRVVGAAVRLGLWKPTRTRRGKRADGSEAA